MRAYIRLHLSNARHAIGRAIRSYPRSTAAVVCVTLSALALGAASPADAAGRDPGHGVAFAQFTGVGADGRDMVWHGAVAGDPVGELTVRLAHVARDGAAHPGPQPVEGIVFVAAGDAHPERSLAAEVNGTMDLQAQRVVADGTISVGARRGQQLRLVGRLIDGHLSADVNVGALVATR